MAAFAGPCMPLNSLCIDSASRQNVYMSPWQLLLLLLARTKWPTEDSQATTACDASQVASLQVCTCMLAISGSMLDHLWACWRSCTALRRSCWGGGVSWGACRLHWGGSDLLEAMSTSEGMST